MKRLVLPLAILAMLMLLAAAAAWDCLRLAADGRSRVALADQEMQTHELRLVRLLSGYEKITPEVQSAISTYHRVAKTRVDTSRPESLHLSDNGRATRRARHDAYDSVVDSFRRTMSADVDPTNPLERAFMDNLAGAINRREVIDKQYDDEMAAYQSFLNSRRGSVARWLSPTARADWNR